MPPLRLLPFLIFLWSHRALSDGPPSPVHNEHQEITVSHPRNLNNPKGTFRATVLLVRFSDHKERPLPPRSHFVDLCKPLQRYLALQSYGQYTLTCNVTDWMDTDNTEAFYADNIRGFRGSNDGSQFFRPVLDQLEKQGTNWRHYDRDEDGLLDAVLVIHSGFPSEAGSGIACNASEPEDRIRSQGWKTSSLYRSWRSPSMGIRLYGYAVSSAFNSVCDLSDYVDIGVPAHELLHTVGTLDVYDQSTGRIGGLGNFDIMANPRGPGRDASLPGSMSPFSKMLCEWLEPTEIIEDGVYEIRPANQFPEAYIISRGFPSGEYLLLEYRQPKFFDTELYGDGGMLIYHVDNSKKLQNERGFPGQPGWPESGRHYQVALVPADGKYDIEQGINDGDEGDLWLPGMTLGPGSDGSYPNTDSYQGGQIRTTGIEITILSMDSSFMSFHVSQIPEKKIPPIETSKDEEVSKLYFGAESLRVAARGDLTRSLRGIRGK